MSGNTKEEMEGNSEITSRTSLLDVIMSKYNQLKDTKSYSRLFYVAKKTQKEYSEGSNSSTFHLSLFQKAGHKEEDYYGLLFESQEFYVHILEGTRECLMNYLRVLYSAQIEDEFLREIDYKILNVKILMYTDDIGRIHFPRWLCKELQQVNQILGDDDDDALSNSPLTKEEEKIGVSWVIKIYDILNQLLSIGKKIMGLSLKHTDNFMVGELPQSFPELIPKESAIKELFQDCEHCLTISEFLEVYDSPVDLELSGENVWPTQTRLLIK
ncbi:hypothetical protein ABK040_016239 [Willaertia magna]